MGPYCQGVCTALTAYAKAMEATQSAGKQLQIALKGKKLSRCLFTNALPELGDLGATLGAASDLVESLNASVSIVEEGIRTKVVPVFQDLLKVSSMSKERNQIKSLERSCTIYEKAMLAALKSRRRLNEEEESIIVAMRSEHELTRFDLCRGMNRLDSGKKLAITEASYFLHDIFQKFCSSMQGGFDLVHDAIQEQREALPAVQASILNNERLWDGVRDKLEGELRGALPPPGAPLGALSPGHGPVGHVDCWNLFNITLTTEIVSSGTRATRQNITQVEGVHKQGYLISEGRYTSSRSRRWYRLYKTTLYKVTLPNTYRGTPRVDSTAMCDVYGAAISAQIGSVPHKFSICTALGDIFEFQAENGDEAMLWLWALRRCANGGIDCEGISHGKAPSPLNASESDAEGWLVYGAGESMDSVNNDNDKDVGDLAQKEDATVQSTAEETPIRVRTSSEVIDELNPDIGTPRSTLAAAYGRRETAFADSDEISVVFGEVHDTMQSLADAEIHKQALIPNKPRVVTVRKGPTASRVQAFLAQNSCCAECSCSVYIVWVSVNIGVTLCEDCSSIHARLGWAISKLRCVTLDDFSDWQCDLLLNDLGNARSLAVLEASVPRGWVKPMPSSSFEDKSQWITAKYRWRAFVSDVVITTMTSAETDENNIRDEECLTRGLCEAAREGSVEHMRWWLYHRSDVNKLFSFNGEVARAPLHEAISKGHVSAVSYLALQGADFYLQDGNGFSSLAYIENDELAIDIDPGDRRAMLTIIFNTLRADC